MVLSGAVVCQCHCMFSYCWYCANGGMWSPNLPLACNMMRKRAKQ